MTGPCSCLWAGTGPGCATEWWASSLRKQKADVGFWLSQATSALAGRLVTPAGPSRATCRAATASSSSMLAGQGRLLLREDPACSQPAEGVAAGRQPQWDLCAGVPLSALGGVLCVLHDTLCAATCTGQTGCPSSCHRFDAPCTQADTFWACTPSAVMVQ